MNLEYKYSFSVYKNISVITFQTNFQTCSSPISGFGYFEILLEMVDILHIFEILLEMVDKPHCFRE